METHTLVTLLHLVAPRALLVIAVMVAALSVCVRQFTIEAINSRRVGRGRSTFYGNLMGIATAVFTFPTSMQIVASSTGDI